MSQRDGSRTRSGKTARGLRRIAQATVLAVAAFVPALASPASATPVTGAAFTTVNEAMDGTGNCLNGNPDVNCDIYTGKQYVWLNGGPSTAYVGDGSYFFAVLAPGGQADPNDGSSDVLSTDAYTNRTFSVNSGTVTYTGSHDFDSNKIRLMPYDDTTNHGGVYMLAICSLADGYPVTASNCKYDQFRITTGEVTEGLPLTVSKDATGSNDNTYTWTISKDVDKTIVKQVGGSATFNYTVKVTHDAGTISGVKVAGKITVFNSNLDSNDDPLAISGVDVTDELSDGTVCSVTNGAAAALTQLETQFEYTCNLSALPQGQLDNTATVAWPEQLLDNGALLDAGSADFTFKGISFTVKTIDECVDVTDTVDGTLGRVCVGDPNPTSFGYSHGPITVPATGCVSYDNTASYETNDTQSKGSASKRVYVCGPALTSALTIGFWKNTNGNSLISNYCAPAGKPNLATYLSGLGGGGGPFAGAAGKTCPQLVTYVNSVISGASATNMNNMLKAQMLATALDVYFSNPSLGYTSTAVGKTKPPSNFLTNGSLGGVSIDTTAVCPMVDNLSTGSASCTNNTASTNAVLAGALPFSAMSVQSILDYEATTPSPFNASLGVWYGGDRTKQEIAKNVFDQINNRLAFAALP